MLWVLICIQALLLTTPLLSTAQATPPLLEREIIANLLLDFFTATGGTKWTLNNAGSIDGGCTTGAEDTFKRELWSTANASNTPVCNWFGVQCDTNNQVVKVSLLNCGLSGTLPQTGSVSLLRLITEFDISNNRIGGPLPPSYSAWGPSITRFHVQNNEFTGTLPGSYAAWSGMRDFSIAQNRLTGTLPSAYKNWATVEVVAAHQNALSGSLPPEFSEWSLIIQLFVSANRLTGELPKTFQSLKRLTRFEFFQNNIFGGLPVEYSSCASLKIFSGSSNNLNGVLPAAWGSALTQLELFDISINGLTGTVPSEYFAAGGMCTSLTHFNVGANQLSGTFPLQGVVRICTRLLHLFLFQNNFTGQLFDSDFGSNNAFLSGLISIDVGGNNFTGSIPNSDVFASTLPAIVLFSTWKNSFVGAAPLLPLVRWKNLTTLRLDGNQFTGDFSTIDDTVKSSISSAATNPFWECHIEMMYVSDNNKLTGSLPQSFSNCTNMTYFFASNLNLTGTIHQAYTTAWASTIRNFSVSKSGLSGTIPPGVSNWSHLLYFDVSENNFTGSLSFANQWRNVELFNVAMNRFSGTLPSGLKHNTNLEYFYVQTNNLTGTLDPEYSAVWPLLRFFFVHENQFGGVLPPSYSLWKRMRSLYLYTNQLVGTLPADWSMWGPSVLNVKVNSNQLTGTLPPQWAQWSNIATLLVHSNSLSGTLPGAWGSLSSLKTFMMDRNNFTGTLPVAWSALSSIDVLSFSHNNLTGTLPSQWSAIGHPLFFIGCQNNTFLGGDLPPNLGGFLMSICGTGIVVKGKFGPVCFPCVDDGIDIATLADESPTALLNNCKSVYGDQTQAPVVEPPSSVNPTDLPPKLQFNPLSLSTAQDAAGVSIIGGAGVAAIAGGDPGSAQMLMVLLLSSCMCGHSSSSGGGDGGALASIVSSLTLSPFSSISSASMAFGNSTLMFALLGLQAVVLVVMSRCSSSSKRRHAIVAGGTGLVVSWRRLCTRPEAASIRFPNVAVTGGLFLVPGVVRGSVVVLGEAAVDSSALAIVAAVASVLLLIAYLVGVLEYLIYRTLILEDAALTTGSNGGGKVLLHFEPYSTAHPFSPPIPPALAAYAMGRGGVWMPSERRSSFGKLVSSLSPARMRWWVVTPLLTVVTTLLASLPITSTGGCDAMQGVTAAVTALAAAMFVAVRPHRAVGASLVAAFSLLVVSVTSALGLLCRRDVLSLAQLLSVCSSLSYVSLVGKVYVAALPFVEQRLLHSQPLTPRRGRQAMQQAAASSSDISELLTILPQPQRRASRRRRAMTAVQPDDEQLMSLQCLVEFISRSSHPGGSLVADSHLL
jgi:hypothetical protein